MTLIFVQDVTYLLGDDILFCIKTYVIEYSLIPASKPGESLSTNSGVEIVKSINESRENLGDVIRAIERRSGQPSQLIVMVGEAKYLIGDLRKRGGEYRLEINSRLASSYKSFDALEKAVESTQVQGIRRLLRGNEEAVYLIGSPEQGYFVAVPGMNMGSFCGQTYDSVGRIIFPLLQEREVASVERIS